MYERCARSAAAADQELYRQIEQFAAEFDLAYVRENMDKILQSTRQGVKRVADIVQNLRGFARLDRAEVNQTDVNEAIKAALEMLRGRLERDQIALEEHTSNLPLLPGSPAQLNQVFSNLWSMPCKRSR